MVCGDNKLGRRFYCIPRVFKPTASLLFHNNGDGTFTEVTRGTDIARALGKGLGVVATDINNDGRMDLFVANDTVQNFLFVNRGKGKWDEIGLAAEVGFSANGQPRSGMGVDAADFDGDGWQDLFVANVDQEMFSLYRNNGDETFSDVAAPHGVGAGHAPSQRLGAEVLRLRQRRRSSICSWPTAIPTTWSTTTRSRCSTRSRCCSSTTTARQLRERERAGGTRVSQSVSRARPGRRRLQQRRRASTCSSATTAARPSCCTTTPARATTGSA